MCKWKWSLAILVWGALAAAAPGEQESHRLAQLQPFVGQWKGVGQLQRGSNRGAWRENLDSAWKFAEGMQSLTFRIDEPRFFRVGQLSAASDGKGLELEADFRAERLRYVGDFDEQGTLVLLAADPPSDAPARIQIRLVAQGQRMLILFERSAGPDRFLRLAEVGYTREGSNFGQGTSFVECIVTGGLATIPVSHEGQTYYVCCTGCRDYFQTDPAAVLAEYRARRSRKDPATGSPK